MSKVLGFNAIDPTGFNSIDEMTGLNPAEATGLNPLTLAARMAAAKGQRLTDPRQRAAVLASFRASLRSHLPELAELLGVDRTTQDELIELLVEQQLAELHRIEERQETFRRSDHLSWEAGTVAACDRDRAALKQLLGATSFRRYLDYLATLVERRTVAEFDARLGGQVLTRVQKEALIALLGMRNRQFRTRLGSIGTTSPTSEVIDPRDTSPASLLRATVASTSKMHRQLLEITEVVSRELLEAAAAILPPAQLTVLTAMEKERIDARRSCLGSLGQQFGLDPDALLSDSMTADRPSVQLVRRPLRWAIQLKVNRSPPQLLSFTGASEQLVTFDAAEGLQVEALPRAFDDGRLWVELMVYEGSGTDRQFIGALADTVQLRPTFAAEFSSSSGTVLAGSKGYAIKVGMTGALQ